MHPYIVNIGPRGTPRLSFGVMAESSTRAVEQHLELATEGERVEAISPREEVPFQCPLEAQRRLGAL